MILVSHFKWTRSVEFWVLFRFILFLPYGNARKLTKYTVFADVIAIYLKFALKSKMN